MSISKRYYKTKPVCTVTFRLDKSAASAADSACVLGEFNDWAPGAVPMQKLKDGTFKASVDLEPGREYAFRYLLDESTWQNDAEADAYAPTPFHDAENSVISV